MLHIDTILIRDSNDVVNIRQQLRLLFLSYILLEANQ